MLELENLRLEASGLASVMGAVASLEEANEFLETASGIDVVFVDINLAGSSDTGLGLVRAHHARPGAPKVVFATAIRDHAIEAFELGAVDYVTKPFSSERIVSASGVPRRRPDLGIRVVRSPRRAPFAARGVRHRPVARRDRAIVPGRFLRVHRNWLVNTTHVRALERDAGDTALVVGAGYEETSAGIH